MIRGRPIAAPQKKQFSYKLNKKTIVITPVANFPVGYASVEKHKLLSRGFRRLGYNVYIINQISSLRNEDIQINSVGHTPSAVYIYSGRVHCRSGLSKTFYFFKGLIKEASYLKRIKTKSNGLTVIFQYHKFFVLLYYWLLSRILHFDIYLNLMEKPSALRGSINALLFEKLGPRFVKGIIVISDHLLNEIHTTFPQKKLLKIPTTVDFDEFKDIPTTDLHPYNYVTLCATAAHDDIIHFVLESFSLITDRNLHLMLVINGTTEEMHEVKERIAQHRKRNRIHLLEKLSREELIKVYYNSFALLIPLKNTIRDNSRFPHKIGEYVASGRPIVSMDFGEVKNYFYDDVSAALCESYDVLKYAEKVDYLVNNPEKAKQIGTMGYELGRKHFDYIKQTKDIIQFFEE